MGYATLAYATLLDLPCFMMLDIFFITLFFLIFVFFILLDFLYIKPHYLPLIKPCFAAWASLYHVRLRVVFMILGCLIYLFMLHCFTLPTLC